MKIISLAQNFHLFVINKKELRKNNNLNLSLNLFLILKVKAEYINYFLISFLIIFKFKN
jgi:hypothetical protein